MIYFTANSVVIPAVCVLYGRRSIVIHLRNVYGTKRAVYKKAILLMTLHELFFCAISENHKRLIDFLH